MCLDADQCHTSNDQIDFPEITKLQKFSLDFGPVVPKNWLDWGIFEEWKKVWWESDLIRKFHWTCLKSTRQVRRSNSFRNLWISTIFRGRSLITPGGTTNKWGRRSLIPHLL